MDLTQLMVGTISSLVTFIIIQSVRYGKTDERLAALEAGAEDSASRHHTAALRDVGLSDRILAVDKRVHYHQNLHATVSGRLNKLESTGLISADNIPGIGAYGGCDGKNGGAS
jgi:hypothetical protein